MADGGSGRRRAIISAIEHLFAKLLATLTKKHLAAKLFVLSITDSENNSTHKELSLASATGDASHLKAIIIPVIESLVFCGEITSIFLEARDTSQIVFRETKSKTQTLLLVATMSS